jgi:hypothetical protein
MQAFVPGTPCCCPPPLPTSPPPCHHHRVGLLVPRSHPSSHRLNVAPPRDLSHFFHALLSPVCGRCVRASPRTSTKSSVRANYDYTVRGMCTVALSGAAVVRATLPCPFGPLCTSTYCGSTQCTHTTHDGILCIGYWVSSTQGGGGGGVRHLVTTGHGGPVLTAPPAWLCWHVQVGWAFFAPPRLSSW